MSKKWSSWEMNWCCYGMLTSKGVASSLCHNVTSQHLLSHSFSGASISMLISIVVIGISALGALASRLTQWCGHESGPCWMLAGVIPWFFVMWASRFVSSHTARQFTSEGAMRVGEITLWCQLWPPDIEEAGLPRVLGISSVDKIAVSL